MNNLTIGTPDRDERGAAFRVWVIDDHTARRIADMLGDPDRLLYLPGEALDASDDLIDRDGVAL